MRNSEKCIFCVLFSPIVSKKSEDVKDTFNLGLGIRKAVVLERKGLVVANASHMV